MLKALKELQHTCRTEGKCNEVRDDLYTERPLVNIEPLTLSITKGKWALLRILDATTATFFSLHFTDKKDVTDEPGDTVPPVTAQCEMRMVAADGIPTTQAYNEKMILLNPASRRDVLIRCKNAGHAFLSSRRSMVYKHNHVWWVGPILKIVIEQGTGPADDDTKPQHYILPNDRRPCYLTDLRNLGKNGSLAASSACKLKLDLTPS